MKTHSLFLTLKVFSATGGIEKVCRIAGKALHEINLQEGGRTDIYSMHDRQQDAAGNTYFPDDIFTGFGAVKIKFVLKAVMLGRKMDVIILSHINLLLVGWLIKIIHPKVKLIMIAHGIEVWEKQPWYKIIKLRYCDLILPVSAFTGDVMVKKHGIDPAKMQVLNNCLDPNLPIWIKTDKDPQLLKRYGFIESDQIIFTLTRLSAGEKYKGYDKVIEAMESLVKNNPQLKYLIAGKYDTEEKSRLDKLIAVKKLGDHIVFAGFVPDDELAAHFNLATLYVMPSRKEGFGIVFIEAMHYGLPVIAGNQDGSVDALAYGEFGLLVDPTDSAAISQAIEKVLNHLFNYQPNHNALMKRFGYGRYKERLKEMVGGWSPKRYLK